MFQFITETVPIAGFGSALILGLIIGLRHSTDGDHIVAVSTMARDYQSLFKGLWVGLSWGLGHSTPLLILGIIILLLKETQEIKMLGLDTIDGFINQLLKKLQTSTDILLY